MRRTRLLTQLKRAGVAIGLTAALVGLGGCGPIEDVLTGKAEKEALAAQEEAAAAQAELEAAEERAQQEARARAEAEARAESEALAARQALEAAERQLAEKESLLAEKEEQLRRQQALQERQQRLAAQQAALEERERALFEHERELEAREVNMAVAEDELRARAEDSLGGDVEAEESGDWSPAQDPAAVAGPGDEDMGGGPIAAESERSTASLQPGKVMEVEILETLSSRTHRRGDTFSARLVGDLRAEDGTLVVPAGAEIEGEVVEVTPLRKVGGQASIGIEFTRIAVSPGESVEIRASVSELGADKSKDKKKIIGATIAGAILGRVLGGKGGENAVLGAAAGAAAGTAAVARSKGKDAVIEAGELIALQLEEVVTVEIGYGGEVLRD